MKICIFGIRIKPSLILICLLKLEHSTIKNVTAFFAILSMSPKHPFFWRHKILTYQAIVKSDVTKSKPITELSESAIGITQLKIFGTMLKLRQITRRFGVIRNVFHVHTLFSNGNDRTPQRKPLHSCWRRQYGVFMRKARFHTASAH